MAGEGTPGVPVTVEGQVRDGRGAPVADALLEVWQANADGHCNHPEDPRVTEPDPVFDGFGRVQTNPDGTFVIRTIKPGAVPGPGGRGQAPHLVLGVFARGLQQRLVTRVYFGDEPDNGTDAVLAHVPESRRSTLVAAPGPPGRYRFDIVLQGPDETVFFDV